MRTIFFVPCFFVLSALGQQAWFDAVSRNAGAATGGGGGSPAFLSELIRSNDLTASFTVTVAPTVTAGTLLSVLCYGFSVSVTNVTDQAGNVYTPVRTNLDGNYRMFIWKGVAASAPSYITVSYDNNTTSRKIVFVSAISNASTTDSTAVNSSYGTSISCPGTTTASATVCDGMILEAGTSSGSYSGSAWTVEGAPVSPGNVYLWHVHYNAAASGSQNPSGSLSVADSYDAIWAAFK